MAQRGEMEFAAQHLQQCPSRIRIQSRQLRLETAQLIKQLGKTIEIALADALRECRFGIGGKEVVVLTEVHAH